jgi:hypothetical protein
MPEWNAWVDRDPFGFIERGPLTRSDYGWGGRAWTRPILPRPAESFPQYDRVVNTRTGEEFDVREVPGPVWWRDA